MKLTTKRFFSAVTVATLMPVAAFAQSYPGQGYLLDGSGKIVSSPTAGMCWHTGDWTPALAVEPCDPMIKRAVIAPASAPKPTETVMAPVAAVPAPVTKLALTKLSFSADALFAFDKFEIKPEGKSMLDDLVHQINGAQYDQIVLTGHADRIGNAMYNQKLSERRATSVKDYLVQKQIPGTRISATGVGETQPVTKVGDCARIKLPSLVACLQPDRRVDVEMTGTKTADQR